MSTPPRPPVLTQHKRVHRFALIAILAALLVSAGWVYLRVRDRIIFTDLDSYTYLTQEQRRAVFSLPYPTSGEIYSYLRDATILHSNPSVANVAYYFDANHSFVRWFDPGYPEWRGHSIDSGTWSLKSYLEVLTYNEKRRITIAYAICLWLPDRDSDSQADNCHIVGNLEHALGFDGREYRRGNPFHLSASADPPFRIPRTEITIDSMLRILNEAR
jgi:hypothetical protein